MFKGEDWRVSLSFEPNSGYFPQLSDLTSLRFSPNTSD